MVLEHRLNIYFDFLENIHCIRLRIYEYRFFLARLESVGVVMAKHRSLYWKNYNKLYLYDTEFLFLLLSTFLSYYADKHLEIEWINSWEDNI